MREFFATIYVNGKPETVRGQAFDIEDAVSQLSPWFHGSNVTDITIIMGKLV